MRTSKALFIAAVLFVAGTAHGGIHPDAIKTLRDCAHDTGVKTKAPSEDLEEFKNSLGIGAEDSDRLFNMGTLYLRMNKPEEAARLFEYVVAKNERDTEAYNLLGLAYRGCGRIKDAIEVWKKSLSIDPSQIVPRMFIEEVGR